MIRAYIRTALVGSLALGLLVVACRRTSPIQGSGGGAPVVTDTTGVVAPLGDTLPVNASVAHGRAFNLLRPGQRDSLRAMIRKERELWRASGLRDYQFLLRVQCFCPGVRGWLLMEVRSSQPLRAWDSAGKPVAVTDWNTLSIDGLFDNLERTVDIDGVVEVAFDARWHFPANIRTVRVPGPDRWAITEARGLRAI